MTKFSEFDAEWDDIPSGRAADSVWREIKSERVHVTKHALTTLSRALRDGFAKRDLEDIYDRELPPRKVKLQPTTPELKAEEPSPEPMDLALSGTEPAITLEEKNILDDLLEHVEQEMRSKTNPSTQSHGLSSKSLDQSPRTACTRSALAIDKMPRTPICPFNTSHPRVGSRNEDEMALDAVCMDDYLLLSSDSDYQDHILDSPEVDDIRSKMLVEPILGEESEEPSKAPLDSANSQAGPQTGVTRSKISLLSDDSLSHLRRSITDGSNEFRQSSLQECLKPEFNISDARSKTSPAPQSDPNDVDRGTNLITPFNALVYTEENIPHFSVPEHAPAGELRIKLPKLAPYDIVSRVPGAETVSRTLQKLDKHVSLTMRGLESEKDMNWTPFKSEIMNVTLEESITDDQERHLRLISPPSDIVQSCQLLFKEPGLRILDEDEDTEDELEEDEHLADLVSTSLDPRVPQKRPMIDDLLADLPLSERWSSTKKGPCVNEIGTESFGVPFSHGFSASSALETFLDLRGGQFKRVKPSIPPATALEIQDDPIQTQTQEPVAMKSGQNSEQTHYSPTSMLPVIQVPATPVNTISEKTKITFLPELKSLSWKRFIMAKTSMLKTHRNLITFLECQGGSELEVIYRELNSASDLSDTSLEHPDVILNPKSCLIYTNSQALNQKSLPGQDSQSSATMVRNRILALAQEYDRVFVIVTGSIPAGVISQIHIDTMTAFTGFCASIKLANVTPVWAIPTNSHAKAEDAVHAWTWTLISQHGFPTSQRDQNTPGEQISTPLIHDETSWEHFLRKSGMNPMAAQVVLGMLPRASCTGDARGEESWGLSRLVRMSAQQRMDMFETVVGKWAIARINSVLDGEWCQR
ncbi:hypothetical protein LTR84_005431 [Exophiala bonariae]|uniref:Uncharacterized protein n=1 Tax=Exophiala bonariae TaxID=1690606 RepID=A0AAV9N3Z8_9EURO|nr:hypothetical protein LTR84_005431 [Exophiala bonariae]